MVKARATGVNSVLNSVDWNILVQTSKIVQVVRLSILIVC